MCKGKKENIAEITKLSNLLKTWDYPWAINNGQTTHKMILLQDTHLWCLWHLSTNCSCKLWSSTIRTPKHEANELCCVVDYATLTWKQGCNGLKCQCKVFIVHISNHAHTLTSPKNRKHDALLKSYTWSKEDRKELDQVEKTRTYNTLCTQILLQKITNHKSNQGLQMTCTLHVAIGALLAILLHFALHKV
jgi:hypothetical protein